MGASIIRRTLLVGALLQGAYGCQQRDAGNAPVAGPPVLALENLVDGKVVLGSPRLTAGVPGSGPLTLADVEQWLDDAANHRPLDFLLPAGLREAQDQVYIPSDNLLTRAKIELGRQLFFDQRLSKQENSMSCGACHPPSMNYSFGNVFAPQRFPYVRTVPVVFNRIFSRQQFWDGRAASLEEQALGPLTNPFEMANTPDGIERILRGNEVYRVQFERIFGEVTIDAVCRALASFERVLVSSPSPYDLARELRKLQDQPADALTPNQRERILELQSQARDRPFSKSAQRGETLFFSQRLGCGQCHSGPNLTDEAYHNVGVGMESADPDLGRFKISGRDDDYGAFKTPTLRNAAARSSYMHNGQLKSLEQVIDWFAQGGYDHPQRSPKIKPFDLADEERQDLLEFLKALTGPLPRVESGRLPR